MVWRRARTELLGKVRGATTDEQQSRDDSGDTRTKGDSPSGAPTTMRGFADSNRRSDNVATRMEKARMENQTKLGGGKQRLVARTGGGHGKQESRHNMG